MDLDFGAVRAVVAVEDERSFSEAALMLGISQQAVSKRIAKLENTLGIRLFTRDRNTVVPTATGVRFLVHARALIVAADAAVVAVSQPAVLRIAVHGSVIADANLLRFYLDQNPDAQIEIVMSSPSRTSRQAVIDGRVDAAFARPSWTGHPLPAQIGTALAYLDVLHLLVGVDNPLADREQIEFSELGGRTLWVPGAGFDSEVADFYRQFAHVAGMTLDTERGTHSIGFSGLLDRVAASESLITTGGEGTTTPWHPRIRRIPIVGPAPAYPMALLWGESAAGHPELDALRRFLTANYSTPAHRLWVPGDDADLMHYAAV
ncbi:DNA-binding transcriptional LysR family regulator [Gordonia amarae]|uniref:Putative LysR family transcriptional regulator n=1 Tax=Gordonia amarae NBRC 15530 TaxID=1075090 RepID=G7GPW3_9ACTN|nr:LysR family transcriptional regulator [Gordonia amarae]MCS3879656.1 DNA-binding transcriptional LysR family regulator [Gordonia amarae]GAB05638.1 putative LysR family transcriptional regulator [Gordonia amarae NBRC 15530]